METTIQLVNGCIKQEYDEDQPIKKEIINKTGNHNDCQILQKRYEFKCTIIIIYWPYVVTLNTVITKI